MILLQDYSSLPSTTFGEFKPPVLITTIYGVYDWKIAVSIWKNSVYQTRSTVQYPIFEFWNLISNHIFRLPHESTHMLLAVQILNQDFWKTGSSIRLLIKFEFFDLEAPCGCFELLKCRNYDSLYHISSCGRAQSSLLPCSSEGVLLPNNRRQARKKRGRKQNHGFMLAVFG